jgi:hypothetical protein
MKNLLLAALISVSLVSPSAFAHEDHEKAKEASFEKHEKHPADQGRKDVNYKGKHKAKHKKDRRAEAHDPSDVREQPAAQSEASP